MSNGADADIAAAAAADALTDAELIAETAAPVDHHGDEGMPQLDFSTYPSQIFWVAIALVLLFRLLSKSITPKLERAIEERAATVAGDLEAAETLKAKAAAAEQAYHDALTQARAKAQEIAAKTQADIDAQLAVETAAAEARIAEQTAAGNARLADLQAAADQTVRAAAVDAAAAIVDKLAPSAADAAAIEAAVDARLTAGE